MPGYVPFDGFIYRYGKFQKISSFDVSWYKSANSDLSYAHCNFTDSSIDMQVFGYNDGNAVSKFIGIILTAKESVNVSGFSKITLKYRARISHANHYMDVTLSIGETNTEKATKRITSTSNSDYELNLSLPESGGNRTIGVQISEPYLYAPSYQTNWYGYCGIKEIKLE